MRFDRIAGTLLVFLTVNWLLAPDGVDSQPVISETSQSQHLSPIIFVPGKGGSQIEATVDRTDMPDHVGLPGCRKKLDRYRMWMDLWTFYWR